MFKTLSIVEMSDSWINTKEIWLEKNIKFVKVIIADRNNKLNNTVFYSLIGVVEQFANNFFFGTTA